MRPRRLPTERTGEEGFLRIKGVGQDRLAELGPRFLARIRADLTSAAAVPLRGLQ